MKYNNYFSTTSKAPCQQSSKDRLNNWLSIRYNKKVINMSTFNDIDYWFNYEQGRAKLEKRLPTFTISMYKTLKVLIDNLHYRNLYIDTRENLASVLGCSANKINSKLEKLSQGFIKVAKASKGNLKIEINPIYGFKYNKHSMDYVRGRAVEKWLLDWANTSSRDLKDDFKGQRDSIKNTL